MSHFTPSNAKIKQSSLSRFFQKATPPAATNLVTPEESMVQISNTKGISPVKRDCYPMNDDPEIQFVKRVKFESTVMQSDESCNVSKEEAIGMMVTYYILSIPFNFLLLLCIIQMIMMLSKLWTILNVQVVKVIMR